MNGVPENENCLIVYKFPQPWHVHLEKKLSLVWGINRLYARDILLKSGSSGLIREINNVVQGSSVKLVMFDTDYFAPVDVEVIQHVTPRVGRVLLTFDDLLLHERNVLTARVCDLVLTCDPISALRYQEEGIEASYMPLESSKEIYFRKEVPVDIDVLFFGSSDKADRKIYLDYLENQGVAVRVVGGASSFLSTDELVECISRSKVVLNFSKTGVVPDLTPGGSKYPTTFYQFKGRVIEAGLCGTACVSEYAPGLSLLFEEDEVPTFRSPEECFQQVKRLLENDGVREEVSAKLQSKVLNCYEDSARMPALVSAISRMRRRAFNIDQVPTWYWRTTLRERCWLLLRRPVTALNELARFLIQGAVSPLLRIRMTLEIACWIPARALRRFFSRVTQ